ncbi:MAG: head decoration protein [Oscillospiraceae bacterium]|nr:head decoration protein [Oscillospiraceae bacterium]
MTELSKKIGDMEFDGLVTDLTPPVQVRGGTIAKVTAVTIYKRGTIFGKKEDGTLSIYDGTTTPDCILCDEVVVGTDADVNVAVYSAGCFDSGKVTVAEGYTITHADIDNLRTRGIVFKAATPAG